MRCIGVRLQMLMVNYSHTRAQRLARDPGWLCSQMSCREPHDKICRSTGLCSFLKCIIFIIVRIILNTYRYRCLRFNPPRFYKIVFGYSFQFYGGYSLTNKKNAFSPESILMRPFALYRFFDDGITFFFYDVSNRTVKKLSSK